MVTGTSSYQELFQGLLAERVFVGTEDYLVPVMRLTDDSIGGGGGVSSSVSVTNFPNPQIISGSVSVNNFPSPVIISGSALSLDFPVYAQFDHVSMFYTGTTLNLVKFRTGGASGTVLSTLALVTDGSGNLLTVTRT